MFARHLSLLAVFTFLTFFVGASLGLTGCAQENEGQTEQTEDQSEDQSEELTPEQQVQKVEEAYRAFYNGIRSDDEEVRLAALDKMIPKKADIVFLLGEALSEEKVEKIWKTMEGRLTAMRKQNEDVKREFEGRGDLVGVSVEDARKDEHLAEGLEIVRAEVSVFNISDRTENGGGGSGSYVIIKDRVVFVRGLDEIKSYLDSLDLDDDN